jgi:hypothetical protein
MVLLKPGEGDQAVESPTSEQWAEIDALILAGSIIPGMRLIMKAYGVRLRESRDIFRARYRQLRAERGAEFACADEKYCSGYAEDGDAIGLDL